MKNMAIVDNSGNYLAWECFFIFSVAGIQSWPENIQNISK